MIPINADATTGGGTNDPTPANPNPVNPTASGTAPTLGGCSTTGSTGAGTLLLIGLAAFAARRRK